MSARGADVVQAHWRRFRGVFALLVVAGAAAGAQAPRGAVRAVVLPDSLRATMDTVWAHGNAHWNELGDENMLTQMLGTGKPTQREYLGCLTGRVVHDTLLVTGWTPARDMKRLQFAVTGHCRGTPGLVGTWHTHPFRADLQGHALKEAGLSAQDLATFRGGRDEAVLVFWDIDSVDAAVRGPGGTVIHPAPVVIR